MPSINMLEDNILVEIDGVTSLWDTYYLNLNIVTPGSKRVIFRFKDIKRTIQQGSEHTNGENQPSSAVASEVKIKTESNSLRTTVKFEDEDIKQEDGTDSILEALYLRARYSLDVVVIRTRALRTHLHHGATRYDLLISQMLQPKR
ncbi:hypothetical protein EDB19DRAFT_1827297 [Suillus lakei]|nr:hypothetical protein EDB19DRAFT_1827297 [Suillus lakei]